MLESAWITRSVLGLLLNLIWQPFHTIASMTLDEKIRYGMLAVGGVSLVFAALGVHITPLEICGGMGGT